MEQEELCGIGLLVAVLVAALMAGASWLVC